MERKGKATLTAAMCAVALAVCSVAPAVEFAGGTGGADDPYQIATAAQLIGLGEEPNLYDKHFILTADIDLDPNLPGRRIHRDAVIPLHVYDSYLRRGAQPGPDRVEVAFSGTFHGNGHTVRNCIVYNENRDSHGGLFGVITEEGRVSDLRLENVLIVDVEGFKWPSSRCGALAGENAGRVTGCAACGMVLAYSGPEDSLGGGGLIGRNRGMISRCSARCYVLGSKVGGLVGVNEASGLIVSCSSDGLTYGFSSLSPDEQGLAGGLVGFNAGSVLSCHADGHVLGDEAGGLVGTNAALVRFSSASGVVQADCAGGLVATNGGTVRESYANADVYGVEHSGGLVAWNLDKVVNCYAGGSLGAPARSSYRGGLVGRNERHIVSSYSVTVDQEAEGTEVLPLAGRPLAGGNVESGYYVDPNATDERDYWDGAGRVIALSPSAMTDASKLRGFDFYGPAVGGWAGHWVMPEDGPPVLAWQTEVTGLVAIPVVDGLDLDTVVWLLEQVGLAPGAVSHDYFREAEICYGNHCWQIDVKGQVGYTRPLAYAPAGSQIDLVVSLGPYEFVPTPGNGSEADPYLIETAGQLDCLRDRRDLWGGRFRLAADIDLYGRDIQGSVISRFSGGFDGDGHIIQGLWHSGLFWAIEPTGAVHDLMIEGAVVDEGGILAWMNEGRVFRCSVSGVVGSEDYSGYAGGLVGLNRNSIHGCSAIDVRVIGQENIGGLVGSNEGAYAVIEASYARGIVEGVKAAGGLLGANDAKAYGTRRKVVGVDAGTVRQCYGSCLVVGQDDVGGCIGYADPNTVQEACYFLASGDGGGPDNGLGTALTSVQMQRQSSFVDWDFAETWMICEGQDYPRLRWEGFRCEP